MKEEIYKKILTDMKLGGDVEGGCIVSRDGLLIYSDLNEVHAEAFAAMLATLLSSAEVAMDEIGVGIPKRVIVEGKGKKIVVTGAGPLALLALVTEGDVHKLDNILVEGAKRVEKVMREKK